ncbi:MAG: 50S ribosomal protein L24 [Halobacteria archaeon]
MKPKDPSKQRKKLFRAPYHLLKEMMKAHLSSELAERYKRRAVPIRKGDTVKVLRGEFKGIQGKVINVDRRRMRIYVENVTRKKADGSTVNVPIHVTKVMITQLNLDDEYRKTLLEGGRRALAEWKAR